MIQARYGWTDHYILYELSYCRFVEVARVIAEVKAEEQKQELRNVAFGSWQNYLVISQALGGKKGKRPKTFRQWIRDFGLLPGQREMDPEEKKAFAEKAILMAEEALRDFGEVKKRESKRESK